MMMEGRNWELQSCHLMSMIWYCKPRKEADPVYAHEISGSMPKEEYDKGIDALIDNVVIKEELIITSAHVH